MYLITTWLYYFINSYSYIIILISNIMLYVIFKIFN